MPVPDRWIQKQLKEYDKLLYAEFNHTYERWVIMRKPNSGYGEHHLVMVVDDDNGGYRPLDERVLHKLILIDSTRYKSVADMLRLMNERNHALDERDAMMASEQLMESGKDLYRSYFGSPYVVPNGGWKEFR